MTGPGGKRAAPDGAVPTGGSAGARPEEGRSSSGEERFSGSTLHEFLVSAADEEGFVVSGGVDLERAFRDPDGRFASHVAHYDRWLAAGRAGAMQYLERGRDRRADPRLVLPGARSMFCVAIPYPRAAAGATDPENGPRYARYLQGGDYHRDVADRLERVLSRADAESRAREAGPLAYKVCVDTSAVLERSWAALAGLGWIGKNTLLIHPRHGSYLFLAEALIDRELDAGPRPMPDLCGHCRRCLEACPTGALTAPRALDSRRCTAYLTLEQRGEWELPGPERTRMGAWVAGCDVCQEVCPFNLKPVRVELEAGGPARKGAPEEDASRVRDWIALLEESEDDYRERVRLSAMKRVKPAQFRRNLAAALAAAWEGLPTGSRVELASALRSRVAARLAAETDPLARVAWSRCVERMNAAEARPGE